ncbi:MAG: hypothetical protein MUE35_00195 [Hydrogenophaga sp.]|nr:hypothetical protein [Hydrogenophaga sp.]
MSERSLLLRPTWSMLLALTLLGGAQVARAQANDVPSFENPQIWINVGGFSRHFNRDANYNENNLGLGIEWRPSNELAVMAGVYDNSIGKSSQYAAVNWQPWQIGPVKLGAAIGLMNGYPAVERGGTFFAALPMATIEGKRFGVNLGLIPSINNIDGAVLLQFKMRLK